MLMAIESAAVLSECISEAGIENERLGHLYSTRYRERFGRRLRVSGLLRRVAYRTSLGSAAVRLLSLSDRLCHAVARRTRSAGDTATF
jgi:flavin-dependent dehydrogenase